MVNYPGTLDTSTSLPRAVDGTTPVSSSQYNQTRDAVIAIENELGVLPSATYGTVRNRLDYLESYIVAGGGVQLAQDLGGLATAPFVIGLYGNPVLSTTPTVNYVLTWNGVAWEPKAPSITGGDHNTLSGLQGGTSSQYYHLTSAQHVWLTAGVTTGYWDETKGGTGLTSYATGDVLYADGVNSLGKLTIGSDGYVMRVASGLPYWDNPSWTVSEGGTGLDSVVTGDILYASGTNTLSKLSISDDGYILTLSGGIPVWQEYTPGISQHNSLLGIQGGEVDGYYHFTSYQHAWLTDGYVDGYWGISKGGTGITSYTPGDILAADISGNLEKINGNAGETVVTNSSGLMTFVDLTVDYITTGLTGVLPAATDGYFLSDLSITTDENMVAYVVNTETATVKNLYVTCSSKPSTGNVVITVRKNTIDTAMTVTVNNSSSSRNSKYYEEDLSNTFDVSRGDFISVRFVSDSGASPSDVQVSIELVRRVVA